MLLICVKVFKMKSYGMEFKSKKVVLRIYDNYLFRNISQLKLVSYRNQFLLKGVFEQTLKAIYFVGLIIINKIIAVSCNKSLYMKINKTLQSLLFWI